MAEEVEGITIRPAHIGDAEAIEALVEPFVQQRILLRRSLDELRDLTRNGFVAERDGRIVGFSAVDIYSKKLAELQCLAVARDSQRSGIGRLLVQACIDCARQHQVLELMAITAAEEFFRGCGFDYALPDQKKALFINTRPRY
jgi:amino-acid N-acetyltransferase